MEIHITVANRECTVSGSPRIVCDNSGDAVHFTFDAEWDQYATKIVHFVRGSDGDTSDFMMTGGADVAELPKITRPETLYIGVQAGSLRTTRAAMIPVVPSIQTMIRRPVAEIPPSTAEQIMVRLDELESHIGEGGEGGVAVSYDPATGDLSVTSTGSGSSIEYDDTTGNLQIG